MLAKSNAALILSLPYLQKSHMFEVVLAVMFVLFVFSLHSSTKALQRRIPSLSA